MRLWLISDTHFGHENAYVFTDAKGVRIRKEFRNAAEGDMEMIRRWNAVVQPQDHIYHLGDVAMKKDFLRIVHQLQGHKRLVMGNHDIFDVREYLTAGFQKVMGMRVLEGVLMTHIPVHEESLGRFTVNVHGHIHERPSPKGRYVNVSVERTNYTPVSLEEVKRMAVLEAA